MSKIAQNQGNTPKKIAVALSGGVDSAVAALKLKEAGHELMALFMNNWESDPENPECTASQDLEDAETVADQLGIPLHTVNLRRQYWDEVFQHCLDEFVAGKTPNPDVWCNKTIKFKALLDHAQHLGADLLATGHYARVESHQGAWQLLKGSDTHKDQSYFLHMLNQEQLSKSIFPIGSHEKSDIRATAQKYGLVNHSKKDSTGICFIGERRFKPFLREYLLSQPGNMETPEGKIIGKHDGLMFYTLGQRKGLLIGGQKEGTESPWYVLQKDIKRNTLIVGQGHDHPLLYSKQLVASQLHWISSEAPSFPLTCLAKTRYRQSEKACGVTALADGKCLVEFKEPQRAITPGQSVVFYQGDECLGGGIIDALGVSVLAN